MKKFRVILCAFALIICLSVTVSASESVTEGEIIATEATEHITEIITPNREETATEEEITATEETTEEEEDFKWSWQGVKTYMQEELVPILASVLTQVSTILILISPLLYKIKVSALAFKNAELQVSKTSKESLDTNRDVKKFQKDFMEKIEENNKRLDRNNKKLDRLEKKTDALAHMMYVHSSNNEELVKNGYAKEIGKVYEEMKNLESEE